MVPLLQQLAEQPWYELTPRQALRQYVALSKSAADLLAIGPRLEAEHFCAVNITLPYRRIPEGSMMATPAMLRKRGLLSRLDMSKIHGLPDNCEGCLLGGSQALFRYLPQSADNLALNLARDLNRGEAGRPHTYGASWFTEFVASTEKRTTRQFQSTAKRIDLAAIPPGL